MFFKKEQVTPAFVSTIGKTDFFAEGNETVFREPLKVPYPKRASEDIYGPYSLIRGLGSKHTRDLIAIWIMILIGVSLVIIALGPEEYSTSEVAASTVAAFFAATSTVYQLGKRRFATVDLFSSEIMGRIRINAADGYFLSILNIYTDNDQVSPTVASGGHRSRLVFDLSEDNLFELFHRRSGDLGSLNPPVVDYVTDYYNFHLAVRDEIRDLQIVLANPSATQAEINAHVISVAFMYDIVMISAYRALDLLIEKGAHKWHAWQLCCYVGVMANNFLRQTLPSDDPRFPEVVRRAGHYYHAIKELNRKLSQNRHTLGLNRHEVFF